MTTPKKAWPLWLVANVSLLLLIPAYEYWLTRVVREEYQSGMRVSTAADSVGLPVDSLWHLLWILLPLNLLLWLTLRSYPGRVPLLPRVQLSSWRTAAIEACALLLGGGVLLLIVNSMLHQDWEFALLGLPWLYLVLSIRAVLLARVTRDSTGVTLIGPEVRGIT